MQLIRNSNNPNAAVGVFLLILLGVFAGPMLPNLISRAVPGVTIDTPCEWLRTSAGRAQHQSLLGRSAPEPIALEIATTNIPATADARLTISVIVINRSLGTVPFLFNPGQVRIGDDNTSGLGIIFDGTSALNSGTIRQDAGSFPENNIRILGPRQRCVYRFEFTIDQVRSAGLSANTSVRAFYRINGTGVVGSQGSSVIFSDQGFRTLFVQSAPVLIPPPSQ
jgi:hypothetical protein